jgi:hypothetical protein
MGGGKLQFSLPLVGNLPEEVKYYQTMPSKMMKPHDQVLTLTAREVYLMVLNLSRRYFLTLLAIILIKKLS